MKLKENKDEMDVMFCVMQREVLNAKELEKEAKEEVENGI